MKSIKLEIDSDINTETFDEVNEITLFENDHKSLIFIEDDSDSNIEFDYALFKEYWDQINSINFSKVLQENENHHGLDGFYLTISITNLFHTLSIKLWCPNESYYKTNRLPESEYLIKTVNSIIKLLKSKEISFSGDLL